MSIATSSDEETRCRIMSGVRNWRAEAGRGKVEPLRQGTDPFYPQITQISQIMIFRCAALGAEDGKVGI